MSQTFTAAPPCHRADHRTDVSSRLNRAIRAGLVAVFAHALTCHRADRTMIPVHD